MAEGCTVRAGDTEGTDEAAACPLITGKISPLNIKKADGDDLLKSQRIAGFDSTR